jgi:erythromycin esterase-like protein
MVNIGQLAREQYGEKNVYLVGFGSYKGTVIAGKEWGAPMEEMEVPEAREESIEALLHHQQETDRYILLSEQAENLFSLRIGHRAIGVVYNPAGERSGNYVPSVLSRRYNAFIYLDRTKALHPLHMQPHNKKIPETYPFGI